jgi:AcrR family transcriptional regulator
LIKLNDCLTLPLVFYMAKREYILEKAEKLFAANGYDATSVRDIAAEANINVAMISYYFGCKEKLIEELFRYRMNMGYYSVVDIAGNTFLSPFEKLEKIIEGYVSRVKNTKNFYYVILVEQVINKNKNVLKVLNNSRNNYIKVFESIIDEGYKGGYFQKRIDTIMFMTTLTGTIMHSLLNQNLYLTHHNLHGKRVDLDDEYFNKVTEHLKNVAKSLLCNE